MSSIGSFNYHSGFGEGTHKMFAKLLTKPVMEKHDSLPYSERVKFMYGAINDAELWPSVSFSSIKSGKKSVELRKNGAHLHRKGQETKATMKFTESIAVAPGDNIKLLLAFSSRSLNLFRQEKYFACLQDINRVLLHKECPESLKAELAKRKNTCLKKIKESNIVKSKFLDKCSNKLKSVECNSNPVRKILEVVEPLDKNLTEPREVLCGLPRVENENCTFPNTSSSIKLSFSPHLQRHLTATEDIFPGEVMAHEKPFSSVLYFDASFSHCSYCFVKNDALIPCDGCSLVMYCGTRCRDEAYNLYHQIECDILPILQKFGYNHLDILAVRTMWIGTNQGKKLADLLGNPHFEDLYHENVVETFENKKFVPDYSGICSLGSVAQSCLNEYMSLHLSIKCALLLYILKKRSFFGETNYCDLSEVETLVGNLLLHHYAAIPLNAHAVEETVLVKKSETAVESIGSCLYGLLSLVNHSCNPNARVYFNKTQIVLYATRPIDVGEQICICYGDLYYESPSVDRHFRLMQYGFKCQCEACVNKWPVFEHLPSSVVLLDDKNRSDLVSEVKTLKKKVMKVHDIRESIIPDDVLGCFYDLSWVIEMYLKKPMIASVRCDYGIERLMRMKGNFYVNSNDVLNCMEILEYYVFHLDISTVLQTLLPSYRGVLLPTIPVNGQHDPSLSEEDEILTLSSSGRNGTIIRFFISLR